MTRPLAMSTLGVIGCENRPLAMATLGVICVGVLIPIETEFGGSQFYAFVPLKEMLRRQIPVGTEIVEYTMGTETELVIDGKKYELVAKKTPTEIIKEYDKTEEILTEAVEKLGVSRRKAKKELYNLIIDELNRAEAIKQSVFDDDEEILMILVATDEI